ncbi:MAG: hypothetical protein QM784_36775 [Polyangiaceae bacterium]
MSLSRHPCTQGWAFPPENRKQDLGHGVRRVNLRELCARPGRFEHHLMIVAQIGCTQIEVPTASEPLAFAHINLSDEYVVALPTGHTLVDSVPFRVFIGDIASGEDVLRLNHRVLDMVLHPYGYLHWPGRVRPPYAAPMMPPGMRRTGLAVALVANERTPPPSDRALWVGQGLEEGAKVSGARDVPVLLADLRKEAARVVARIGETRWELLVDAQEVQPARGGYLLVLEADPESDFFATNLIFIAEGAKLDARGVRRALLMWSPTQAPDAPPPSWDRIPDAPFWPLPQAGTLPLPVAVDGLRIDAHDDARVRVHVGNATRDVPRYWLARLLFRVALHGYRLGYEETYEGFFVDDTDGIYRVGLRGAGHVTMTLAALKHFVEHAYRAVAPAGYSEELVP